jgi:hypothetical protein
MSPPKEAAITIPITIVKRLPCPHRLNARYTINTVLTPANSTDFQLTVRFSWHLAMPSWGGRITSPSTEPVP